MTKRPLFKIQCIIRYNVLHLYLRGDDQLDTFSNLTEDELLEKEEAWWEREDELNSDWIYEGVEIFTSLSKANPKEIRYKETLSYLLLLQGEDLKLRQHSYEDAIECMKQVVKLDPSNARAHYRLGFLYFFQKRWTKSIDSFQMSLNSLPRKLRNQLQKDQQIKAHFYILKAAKMILEENFKKVEKIPPKDLENFGEMKLLLEEMRSSGQVEEKPYQMIVNGVEVRNISEREYEELSDPFENKGMIILNFKSTNDVTLSLNGKEIFITPALVALIEYLMRNPDGVSSEDIIQRKYRYSRDPHAKLRKDISRLRSRLRSIHANETLIETIDGGYRWNSSYNYRIFKHSRDVSMDLLLD